LILNCSALLKPLYDILRQTQNNKRKSKATIIDWTSKYKKSYENVKEALAKKTILSFPIPHALLFSPQMSVIPV